MKSPDLEGPFELYVTRTPGYLWALFFRTLHVHPIVVTLLSILIGCTSGYFFYFEDLKKNLLGMFLLIWANWYDCADGQLARMTGQKTLVGRLLDGAAGDLWFFCIYLALVLRLLPEYGYGIWLLAAWAGLLAHTRQCAIADYYRNIHLYFTLGRGRSELDSSQKQIQRLNELRWNRQDWFEHLYLLLYSHYTIGQEHQTPKFQLLKQELDTKYNCRLPESLVPEFRRRSQPLMKWCNVLTFDTRVVVLFLTTILNQPWLYFVFEIVVLESVRYYTRRKHEGICCDLLTQLSDCND